MVAPAISVLMVNYNSDTKAGEALEALAAQTFSDFEALIIDNASTDQSIALARSVVANDTRFRFRLLDKNLGFALGNNLLAPTARGTWLAFLNPDAVPARNWLEHLVEATQRHPAAVMFGSTQLDAADLRRLDGAGDHYLAIGFPWRGGFGWPLTALPAEGEVFSPCAAASLIRADAFREVGGFDARFFCYVEDVDLAFRLRLKGHYCIQVPAAVVRHVGGASSATEGSGFARRHGARNIIWCFVKCMPSLLFWTLLPFHILALVFLIFRAALIGAAYPVVTAIVEGVAGLPATWSARQAVQGGRRASLWRIAAALTWNPVSYLRRAP